MPTQVWESTFVPYDVFQCPTIYLMNRNLEIIHVKRTNGND